MAKMKILLTNNELNFPGGSETACYTLAAELIRLGHEVDYMTNRTGIVSTKMREIGCKNRAFGHYDIAICSHIQVTTDKKQGVSFDKIIRVCHGTKPKLEQPQPGAAHYVAISEEVGDHLKGLGYQSTIIRNGIDCERFKSTRPINPKIKRVLGITASRQARKMIYEACNAIGAKASFISKVDNPRWDTETAINEADLVVSLGRGALEAMACERPVIVWDWRSYNGNRGDGVVLPNNVDEFAKFNFSGRALGVMFNAETIKAQIEDMKEVIFYSGNESTESLRDWVLENANIRKTAQQYLSL